MARNNELAHHGTGTLAEDEEGSGRLQQGPPNQHVRDLVFLGVFLFLLTFVFIK